jgi:hypothetical protein
MNCPPVFSGPRRMNGNHLPLPGFALLGRNVERPRRISLIGQAPPTRRAGLATPKIAPARAVLAHGPSLWHPLVLTTPQRLTAAARENVSSKQNVAVDGARFRQHIYCGKDVGNPTYVCALDHRRGPGGWRRWGSPLAAITLAAGSGFKSSL